MTPNYKPNTPIDIIAYTIPRYPNTLLLELADIVVLIIQNPVQLVYKLLDVRKIRKDVDII